MALDKNLANLLQQVADIHDVPQGAYNLRVNSRLYGKRSSENIEIVTKTDKPGIDIYIKPGTKKESVHIPVLIAETGIKELVYNDFHVGEGASPDAVSTTEATRPPSTAGYILSSSRRARG